MWSSCRSSLASTCRSHPCWTGCWTTGRNGTVLKKYMRPNWRRLRKPRRLRRRLKLPQQLPNRVRTLNLAFIWVKIWKSLFQGNAYHPRSFIVSASSDPKLSQEHWLWRRDAPWMGWQSIPGHCTHIHWHLGTFQFNCIYLYRDFNSRHCHKGSLQKYISIQRWNLNLKTSWDDMKSWEKLHSKRNPFSSGWYWNY